MTFTRDFAADIEIRSDGTGRTVHGILVPYGQAATVSDGGPAYEEAFAEGAFARDLAARAGSFGGVKMLWQHDREQPIGRAVELREDAAGLYGAFTLSRTARGDEALQLLRDGVLDGFSIGFRPVDETLRDGIVWRTKAALRETSLVTFPAYAGALVAGVRAVLLGPQSSPEEGDEAASTADERRSEQPPASDPATAPEPPATPSGLTPAQRRERLHPTLTKGVSS